MAPRFQLLAEGGEVIDLTVEDHPECAVLVAYRLAARLGQVDDTQPRMADAATDALAMVQIDAKVVGAAMLHQGGHPPHETLVDLCPAEIELTADPAHPATSFGSPHEIDPLSSQRFSPRNNFPGQIFGIWRHLPGIVLDDPNIVRPWR